MNVTADASFEAVSGTDNAITPGFWVGNETVTFQVTNGVTLTNGLPIEDYGVGNAYSVTKTGEGTLILNATNTYTGATTVNEGILRVGSTGRINAGTVTVNSGAELEGSGTINSLTVASGVLKVTVATTNSASAWNTGGSMNFAAGSKIDVSGLSLNQLPYVLVRGTSIVGTPTLTGATNFTVSNTNNMIGLTPTLDTDNDGLTDYQEGTLGSNPLVADTDGDGILDGAEVTAGTDPVGMINVGGEATTVTNSTSFTGAKSLLKSGTNTVVLVGTNQYTGTTTVTGGTLDLDGNTKGQLYASSPTASSNVVVVTNGGSLKVNDWNAGSTGSLGLLPENSDRIYVNDGTLILGNTFNSARGFRVGASGATIRVTVGAREPTLM